MSDDTTTESTKPVASQAPAFVGPPRDVSDLTMNYLVNGLPKPEDPVDSPESWIPIFEAIREGRADGWLEKISRTVSERQEALRGTSEDA